MPRIPIVRAVDVAALDAAAAAIGITGATLMARAGEAVADAARRLAPHAQRIVVLAGPGHNGGDGYEAARTLHTRGLSVTLHEATDTPAPLAAAARARLLAAAPTLPIAPLGHADAAAFAHADLVIDALLGAGASRPVGASWARLFEMVRASGAPVLAVDIPSGLPAGTVTPNGPVLTATATIQLAAVKPSSLFAPSRDHYGRWTVDDLGLPSGLLAQHATAWLAESATLEPRPSDAHKFRSGTVLIAGGSPPYPGAAELAARAAFRAGAGYVTLAADTRVGGPWPEVIAIPLTPDALAANRAHVAVIGPGLAPEAGPTLLAAWGDRPAVLDGGMLHPPTPSGSGALRVLTPHAGEAARLLSIEADRVEADPIAAARALARASGAWVVLKLTATVVASPEGSAPIVVPGGGRALAVAGTGDALAGTIGALLAGRFAAGDTSQGVVAEALVAAVTLHAQAARIATERVATGGRVPSAGVIASDVIDALPAARGFLEHPGSAPRPPWRW